VTYTHTVTLSLSYPDAVEHTKEALRNQGFGVLTEIDIRATFGAKLGPEAAESIGDYVILGACNPQLASKALAAEPELGALLPCNVIVRRGGNDLESIVQAIDPRTMVQLSDSTEVRDVAEDADTRLRAVLDALSKVA
jgi:uncharacterized protein (DUF302 family)